MSLKLQLSTYIAFIYYKVNKGRNILYVVEIIIMTVLNAFQRFQSRLKIANYMHCFIDF